MTTVLLERLRAALAPEYVVERELGHGGMGVVFLAREVALDRPVAIKILRPESATAAATERFLREARLLAGLNHPNIVPIHRVGVADGIAYFVMDHLQGATLADRIAAGPVPPVELYHIGRDLLRALSAAHAEGVVHRDVKPSNIFLTPSRTLLGDFGVSKRADSDEDLTDPGAIVGTPGYLAPELMARAAATPLSDLYAAAMSLYEAATRRRWEHPAHVSDAEWKGVPRDIARVLKRGLALEPRRRWPDADAFRRALKRARAAPFVRRTVLLAAAGVLVGVAMARWIFVRPGPAAATHYELAILPFTSSNAADTIDGRVIAATTITDLGLAFPNDEFTFVPQLQVLGWTSRTPANERTPEAARAALHADAVAIGTIVPRNDSLVVHLRVIFPNGTTDTARPVVGARDEYDAIAYQVGFELVRLVAPSKRSIYPKPTMFKNRSAEASRAWAHAEEEFARESWVRAAAAYDSAIALDSTFAPAYWGLYNVLGWARRRPDRAELKKIYDRYSDQLNELERYLVRAELAPAGHARLAVYDSAIKRFPLDANARLLYGNELFSRGALYGIALDSAVTVLESAEARDSFLGPVQSTLAWAWIRLGQCAKSERALGRYSVHAADQTDSSGFSFKRALGIAQRQRCGGARAATDLQDLMETVGGSLPQLADFVMHTLRWAPSLELLNAELKIGRSVVAMRGVPDSLRLNAFEAIGVALVGLGRLDSAYAAFDSAAAIGGTAEYRLQAGQWRLIPTALGVPGVSNAVRARGREIVSAALDDPMVAARAAWTLGIDAYVHGDTIDGAHWRGSLVARGDSTTTRLVPLLDAVAAANRGDETGALRMTDTLGAYDDGGRGGDPFVRTALHLDRGTWLEHDGRTDRAERAWRWYENADVVGWPTGPVQAAEIDWAFGALGALRRARVREPRDRTAACALYRTAESHWKRAVGSFMTFANEVAEGVSRCR